MINKFLKDSFFLAIFFLSFLPALAKDFVLLNENNILNEKVVNKINKIGNELYSKSGITLAVAIGDQISFDELLKEQNKLRDPYVLLILSKKSHKIDIVGSKDALSFFNREKVLSPYPSVGTILPIISSNKGKDVYNASILNGYADISDQIANFLNIKLENSIGNANKDTLNILRIVIYGFLCISVIYYFNRKMKGKRKNA